MDQVVLRGHIAVGVWMLPTRLHVAERLLIDEVVLVLHLWTMHVFFSRAEVTWDHDHIVDCRDHRLYVILLIITRCIGIPHSRSCLAILTLAPSTYSCRWTFALNSSCTMVTSSNMHRHCISMYLPSAIEGSCRSVMYIAAALLNA